MCVYVCDGRLRGCMRENDDDGDEECVLTLALGMQIVPRREVGVVDVSLNGHIYGFQAWGGGVMEGVIEGVSGG